MDELNCANINASCGLSCNQQLDIVTELPTDDEFLFVPSTETRGGDCNAGSADIKLFYDLLSMALNNVPAQDPPVKVRDAIKRVGGTLQPAVLETHGAMDNQFKNISRQ